MAGQPGRAVVHGKDGKHAVPHELQHFTAHRLDRFDHAVEVIIQCFDDLRSVEPVRKPGETTQVAEIDCGTQGLPLRTVNGPRQDPSGRCLSQVGVEQAAGGEIGVHQFEPQGHQRHQFLQAFDLCRVIAALSSGGEGDHVDLPGREPHGQADVVGRPLRLQFPPDIELQQVVILIQPLSHQFRALVNPADRTLEVEIRVHDVMTAQHHLRLLTPSPDQVA